MGLNATSRGRLVIPAMLAAALVIQGAPARAELAKVGKPAPKLDGRDPEGRVFALSDLAYPGRERPRRPRSAVLVDFFRTDCPPCVSKLPELIGQHDRLRARGIRVVLVALLAPDKGEQKLLEFLKENPVPFPVVVDRYEENAKRYIYNGNKFVLPSMIVVDAQGIVQAVGRDLGGKVAEALARVGRPVSAEQPLPARGRVVLDPSGG